jgi:hypothetical protein
LLELNHEKTVAQNNKARKINYLISFMLEILTAVITACAVRKNIENQKALITFCDIM